MLVNTIDQSEIKHENVFWQNTYLKIQTLSLLKGIQLAITETNKKKSTTVYLSMSFVICSRK